jgi:formylmethanofuran dehydrogenase subunit E
MSNIRAYTFDEFATVVTSFHGTAAPGVMIGGYMVEQAMRNLPPEGLYDSIAETSKCLPDAIQLLTPCTIGNGWLSIIDSGRFAIAMYDKTTGEGVRVYIDCDKVESWKEIKYWYFKLGPKREQDMNVLLNQIKEAGTAILSLQQIKVDLKYFKKKEKTSFVVCPTCHEAYRSIGDRPCPACNTALLPYIYCKEVNDGEIIPSDS